VKTPITVGAKLTVKWHREQFAAVARNCRSDGREFLLGVRREAEPRPASALKVEAAAPKVESKETVLVPAPVAAIPASAPASAVKVLPAVPRVVNETSAVVAKSAVRLAVKAGAPTDSERKVMQPKTLIPKFWRRHEDGGDAGEHATQTEVPVNKSNTRAAEGFSGPQGNLLSYQDIYHAAGILSPRSGYGVGKVVEMLNSERIRDLSKEIQRASVLMALDAAGTPVDELLRDATRRQQALDCYEEGQRKQLEEFEARKTKENAEIQAEMERLTAHYGERIQENRDQVAREKEALRNWQMAKQHESQRIAEVIELCAKQPAASESALSATAGAQSARGGGARSS
jgi:hypothetical protein